MGVFDSGEYFRKVLIEFKRTDQFYSSFRLLFKARLVKVIVEYYPHIDGDNDLDSNLNLYADEILSCVEAVVYKDNSYPEFRIQEELDVMTRIVVKEADQGQDPEFIDQIHLAAKAMIVDSYPEIVDLSGNSFRLLEKFSRMYNWEFIVAFYAMINEE
jgi:hypothetical protein